MKVKQPVGSCCRRLCPSAVIHFVLFIDRLWRNIRAGRKGRKPKHSAEHATVSSYVEETVCALNRYRRHVARFLGGASDWVLYDPLMFSHLRVRNLPARLVPQPRPRVPGGIDRTETRSLVQTARIGSFYFSRRLNYLVK